MTAVDRLHALVADIATASSEQRDGISQVNIAIRQIDGAVQQNAALWSKRRAAGGGHESGGGGTAAAGDPVPA